MSASGPVRRAVNSKDDWRTPLDVFMFGLRRIREFGQVGDFTLDAAADRFNTLCWNYRSGPCTGRADCDCGLCSSWAGHSVFVNPPYGSGLTKWAGKILSEVTEAQGLRPKCVFAVWPAATGTTHFANLMSVARHVDFVTGRIAFLDAQGNPQKGNTTDTALFTFLTPVAIGWPMSVSMVPRRMLGG